MIEAAQVKGAGLGARAPRQVLAVGVGVGSPAWPARAGGRTRGAPGPCVGVRETQAGARDSRGAEVSSAARAGATGTGRPVAMATAGRVCRARARGRRRGPASTGGPELPGLWWAPSPSVTLS